jgi:hypothetical protein
VVAFFVAGPALRAARRVRGVVGRGTSAVTRMVAGQSPRRHGRRS